MYQFVYQFFFCYFYLMKTLLALLLLIPSLSWAGIGDTYFCNITDLYQSNKKNNINKYKTHTFKFQWVEKEEVNGKNIQIWNVLNIKDGPIFGSGIEVKGTSYHSESFSSIYDEAMVIEYLYGKFSYSWAFQVNPTFPNKAYIQHTYMFADCTKF